MSQALREAIAALDAVEPMGNMLTATQRDKRMQRQLSASIAFINAANVEAVRALLADNDQQRAALSAARAVPQQPVAWRVQLEGLWFHARDRDGLIAAIGVKLGRSISMDQAEPLYAGRTLPAGMALVPLEPTADMLVAGQEAWMVTHANRPSLEDCEQATAVFRAMLAAAPAQSDTGAVTP